MSLMKTEILSNDVIWDLGLLEVVPEISDISQPRHNLNTSKIYFISKTFRGVNVASGTNLLPCLRTSPGSRSWDPSSAAETQRKTVRLEWHWPVDMTQSYSVWAACDQVVSSQRKHLRSQSIKSNFQLIAWHKWPRLLCRAGWVTPSDWRENQIKTLAENELMNVNHQTLGEKRLHLQHWSRSAESITSTLWPSPYTFRKAPWLNNESSGSNVLVACRSKCWLRPFCYLFGNVLISETDGF